MAAEGTCSAPALQPEPHARNFFDVCFKIGGSNAWASSFGSAEFQAVCAPGVRDRPRGNSLSPHAEDVICSAQTCFSKLPA